MSSSDDSAGSDDDFQVDANGGTRYPVHDCCEFEDAESLRTLIFVKRETSSDADDDDDSSSSSSSSSDNDNNDDDDSSSSSDDNDSHAAAHAAAIGHSPESMVRHTPTVSIAVIAAAAAAAAGLMTDGGDSAAAADTDASKRARTDGGDGAVTGAAEGGPSESKGESSEKVAAATNDAAAGTSAKSQSEETQAAAAAAAPADQGGKEDPTVGSSSSPPDAAARAEGGDGVKQDTSAQEGACAMDVSPEAKTATAPATTTTTAQGNEETKKGATATAEATAVAESNGEGGQPKKEVVDARSSPSSPDRQQQQQSSPSSTKPSKKTSASGGSKKKKKARTPKPPAYYCPCDLNERDDDENTPLHVSVHALKLEHVRLLLKAGASLHRKCDGSAPVHLAISLGAVPRHAEFARECVNVLCEFGADLSVRDDAMHTPLYLSCVAVLPSIASLVLADSAGVQTLNAKADRVGGRALHAAARFDLPRPAAAAAAAAAGGGGGAPRSRARSSSGHYHHRTHAIPGMHSPTKSQSAPVATSPGAGIAAAAAAEPPSAEPHLGTGPVLTQILLATPGIEIDPPNNYGRTPLHVAAMHGNWPVARLLLQHGSNAHALDRRGYTPGQLAQKRGIVIPNDLSVPLGPAAAGAMMASASSSSTRDLIMDPDAKTILLCHELCSRHMSCPPITREEGFSDPPPENVRRLRVLLNDEAGILRCAEFGACSWEGEARRAAMADVLKVHEYGYVEHISQLCSSLPDHPKAIANLDADTAVSRWSFEAAMRAAGGVCEAVDKVMSGDFRNAFCAVRPPGHHAGPRGLVTCPNDPDGSHGFCLLNNVAIGASYARSMYRNDNIRRVAIIDFDVHHGNGTEEIVRQLVPSVERATVRTPFAQGVLQTPTYRPWLDEGDVHDVFFASTHGFGPRDLRFADHMNPAQGGWFYPASGKTRTTDAVKSPSNVEHPKVTDFLHSQTWTRMGEDARSNCCKIINVGLDLPRPHDVPGMQRVELRDAYRKNILPRLLDFDPDMIFISAGFDAHKKDTMNFGYVGMVEDDYEWVTEQLVKVANSCCDGRIVSVLEGGYKIHGGIVSPFARSVASHVRALVDGGSSRELYDRKDGEWESQFERHLVEEKERRRQMKMEKLRPPPGSDNDTRRTHHTRQAQHQPPHPSVETRGSRSNSHVDEMDALMKESMEMPPGRGGGAGAGGLPQQQPPSDMDVSGDGGDGDGEPPNKRRRNHVDYKELFEQMKKEGQSG